MLECNHDLDLLWAGAYPRWLKERVSDARALYVNGEAVPGAMPALRRGDFPRLRTRVGPLGMDYKGYNIAVHELGHNVEQVFSLYEVGETLLAGVPNNAFTEALAFVFQQRDLALLGIGTPDEESSRRRILADFWDTWEIAGVALVEIATWHYLYDHPQATPAELREVPAAIPVRRDRAPAIRGHGRCGRHRSELARWLPD